MGIWVSGMSRVGWSGWACARGCGPSRSRSLHGAFRDEARKDQAWYFTVEWKKEEAETQ